jgi:NADPH-dependent curcumin reductase CurA
MTIVCHEVHLRNRPDELPVRDNFSFVEQPLAAPEAGQLLVKNLYMSVDPYMRGRMKDRQTYIAPFQVGAPLDGAAVGVVVESGHSDFAPGDAVSHFSGWRDYALIDAASANKIDAAGVPVQAYLGPLGFPGLAAYAGLLRLGKPKAGETVFVSAASGAVGSVVAQIAKIKGARVIGSVGSDEKAAWLRDEVGLDAVINYRTASDLTAAIREAAPNGIDIYFDNVGGGHLEAAIEVANGFARFVLCGMIGQYNSAPVGPRNIYSVLEKSLTLQGFIGTTHLDMWPDFARDMASWIADGRMKWRETIVEGLDNAPDAFIGLFAGENFGKMLVKLTDA